MTSFDQMRKLHMLKVKAYRRMEQRRAYRKMCLENYEKKNEKEPAE